MTDISSNFYSDAPDVSSCLVQTVEDGMPSAPMNLR